MKLQKLFLHQHPYDPFLPKGATHLIVGTLPPPRFSTAALKQGDVNFSYGSIDGQLWPILERIYDLDLAYETTPTAVAQRKEFLTRYNIGICDIVSHCYREKLNAADVEMQQVILRDFFYFLAQAPKVHTLLFTGGNSKNGPEYFFRQYLKTHKTDLEPLDDRVPRQHCFQFQGRKLRTYSLIAPSGAANRAIGSMTDYKDLKKENPNYTTFDYRVALYAKVFPKPY